jgi:hypothetical protein
MAPERCPFELLEMRMSKPENPGSEKPSHPPHPDVPPGPPTNVPDPRGGAPKPPGHRPVG